MRAYPFFDNGTNGFAPTGLAQDVDGAFYGTTDEGGIGFGGASRTCGGSGGFGTPWGVTRSWTNGAGYANTSFYGAGEVLSQMPYMQSWDSGSTLVVISSGVNAREFDSNGSNWVEHFYLQDKLTYNSTAHEYTLTESVLTAFRAFLREHPEFSLTEAQLTPNLEYVRRRIRAEVITAAYGIEVADQFLQGN